MKYPKISIVTPSYNQGKFIEETILSVLNQNYPNLEYIVIDGGSIDNSVEVIKKYQNRIAYWVSERDRGQSHAVNKGFKRANGDIIGWLNSDDTYLPQCFKHVVKAFREIPDSDAVYGNFVQTDEKDKVLRKRHVFSRFRYETLLFHPYLGQPAVFFRKKVLHKVGYLDENLSYAMDWDFLLRMKRRCKMVYINHFLATYRLHTGSKTFYQWKDKALEDQCIFVKNKVRRFHNGVMDSLYYSMYHGCSKFQRLYAILRDNPCDYLKVYRFLNRISRKSLLSFLFYKLKD